MSLQKPTYHSSKAVAAATLVLLRRPSFPHIALKSTGAGESKEQMNLKSPLNLSRPVHSVPQTERHSDIKNRLTKTLCGPCCTAGHAHQSNLHKLYAIYVNRADWHSHGRLFQKYTHDPTCRMGTAKMVKTLNPRSTHIRFRILWNLTNTRNQFLRNWLNNLDPDCCPAAWSLLLKGSQSTDWAEALSGRIFLTI